MLRLKTYENGLESQDSRPFSILLAVGQQELVTKREQDIAAFKTPNLRNVLVTGPYFHDGSQETLWDVVDHYNKGDGLKNAYLDEDIQPLALREDEIDDLVAFLASLTSSDLQGTRRPRTGAAACALSDRAAAA